MWLRYHFEKIKGMNLSTHFPGYSVANTAYGSFYESVLTIQAAQLGTTDKEFTCRTIVEGKIPFYIYFFFKSATPFKGQFALCNL